MGTPLSYGVACVWCASQEIPATRKPRISPSATSTCRALRPSGLRNAPTALDTASMPVSDDPPLANAFSSTNTMPKVSSEESTRLEVPMIVSGPCAVECGRSPRASRISPTMIIRMIRPENRYVGTANDRPASLSPRRFR